MKPKADYYVLDRAQFPEVTAELVVYRAQQIVCLGVSSDPGGSIGAIGLNTGSRPHDFEYTSGPINETRTAAWGTVSTGVVRAEIRNDDGEIFHARIVPFPPLFGIKRRAVWGTAERCERDCVIVGYDNQGETIDDVDFAVAPRIKLGNGEDPIGGRWYLWIGFTRQGPFIFRENAWGDGRTGPLVLLVGGFASVGRSGAWKDFAPGCDAAGLVSAAAARVELRGASGRRSKAHLVEVPREVAGPMKAFIAFLPYNDEPRELVAHSADDQFLSRLEFT